MKTCKKRQVTWNLNVSVKRQMIYMNIKHLSDVKRRYV